MSDAAPPKPTDEERNPTFVYVATAPGPLSRAIRFFRLQTKNLEVAQNITLVPLGVAVETPNVSFLELDQRRRLVFVACEEDAGVVRAFKVEPTGQLTLLNERPSMGKRPCHLSLDASGKNLLVANSDGVALVPVAEDGRLEPAASLPGKVSQIQGVAFDPAGRFALACDTGADKVLVYGRDVARGTFVTHEPASVPVKAGPRRLVFRPDGRFVYVVSERASLVTAFAYDAAAGSLKEMQTVSTLPEYFDGPNTPGEVAVFPTGKYLYVSNRGHNSVVLFRIADEGALTYVEEQGTGGRTPRHFGLEPAAKHLAIANEGSDTVLASRIDATNGRLKPSGIFASAPSPVCVKFLSPSELAP